MNEYTPNIQFYTKVNCYRKDMMVFPPNSALLGKMNMGKPYNGKYPMLVPITNGSLLWKTWVPSQKSGDKESLINGTRGVEILLCDGKHMEFFNRATEALAEFCHAHCQHSLLLFLLIRPAGKHSLRCLSPKRWKWLLCETPIRSHTRPPCLPSKKSIIQCIEST